MAARAGCLLVAERAERQNENTHVNKSGSTHSEEKKARVPVVTHQKEQEVGNVSDVADQKWSFSLGIARNVLPKKDIQAAF